MPLGTLPKPLIIRLRKVIAHGERIVEWPTITRIEKVMARMKNADHRGELVKGMHMPTYFPGGRVRELDVHKSYPAVGKVIVKRVHEITAPRLIRLLRRMVDMHNARFPSKLYTLRKPVAYALNEEYVAMRKVSFPSVAEIVGSGYFSLATNIKQWDGKSVTARGTEYFAELARKHPACTKEALMRAVTELEYHTDGVYHRIYDSNVLLTGFANGKFIFVPLIDLK